MHVFYNHLTRLFIISMVLVFTFVRAAMAQQTQTYPRVTGYFSVSNPIATLSSGKVTDNFSKVYTVNFPFGLNLIKSDRFGISFELSPAIRTENNISKVNSVGFNPGAVFRFKNNFNFIQRVAFETNGRFGFTSIINKVVLKGKDASLFVAIPLGTRFGNNAPTSLTAGLQAGVFF